MVVVRQDSARWCVSISRRALCNQETAGLAKISVRHMPTEGAKLSETMQITLNSAPDAIQTEADQYECYDIDGDEVAKEHVSSPTSISLLQTQVNLATIAPVSLTCDSNTSANACECSPPSQTAGDTVESGNVYEVADQLRTIVTSRDLQHFLSRCLLQLSTKRVFLLFSRLKVKSLGLILYSWMKTQPGFQLNDDVFSIAAQNFIRYQKWQATEDLYVEAQQSDISLASGTFIRIIQAFTKARRFDLVEKWFNRMADNARPTENRMKAACNGLMLAYYKQKLYLKVFGVFQKMRKENIDQDLNSFCIMISALRDAGELQKALELSVAMQNQGIHPDKKAYSIIIDTMGKAGKVSEAASLFLQMQQQGMQPDSVAYNTLIHAFAKAKMYKQARLTFEAACSKSIKLDPIIFSTIIKMYSDAGMPEQAHEVFKRMAHAPVKTHEYAYHTVMNAYARANRMEEVVSIYRNMRASGCPVREVTYTTMIKVYAKLGNQQAAERIFQQMVKNGFTKNVVAYCTIIDMYSKVGNVDKALLKFVEMRRAGCRISTWAYNIMIDMFGKLGNFDDALLYFEEMRARQVCPDSVTYSSLILAASRGGQNEKAMELVRDVKSAGMKLDAALVGTMVNAMIKSEGYLDLEALVVEAQKAGVQIDRRMYRTILNAFLQAKLVDKANWLEETIVPVP